MKMVKREYQNFLSGLKQQITFARQKIYQTVNRQLVELYYSIGGSIHEKIDIAQWGEGIVEKLAVDLQRGFPDVKGLSPQNLWRMKQLYEIYKDHKKLSTLLRELSWSHHLLLLGQTSSIEEKEFYLKTSIHERWSVRELQRQIGSSLYERYIISRKTDSLVPCSKDKNFSTHFKDEYLFDFLGLKDSFKEKDLSRGILSNLKQFFLEFGQYFTLAGEEYRVSVGREDYFIDLLFYHRILKCFVAVELKIGKFKPEYAGKMQFYLSALDEKIKLTDENPSVGIILCKSKNDEVVRITLSKALSPMKVATYRTKLIDSKLLKQKLHSLPAPQQKIGGENRRK